MCLESGGWDIDKYSKTHKIAPRVKNCPFQNGSVAELRNTDLKKSANILWCFLHGTKANSNQRALKSQASYRNGTYSVLVH